ncbi:MAG: hypothetical protein GXY43_06995 [Clostridiaceae bacterium]|nr:hypothetical protein [Clostridiaceae bacterium]
MKAKLAPSSKLGLAAVVVSGILVLLGAIRLLGTRLRFGLPLSMQHLAVVGLLGSLLGLIALLKFKDKSILTIATIVIGVLIAVWLVLEYIVFKA